MAFMIVSAGRVASSATRTVRLSVMVVSLLVVVLLMFAAGLLVGARWLPDSRSGAPMPQPEHVAAVEAPVTPELPEVTPARVAEDAEDRLLIERLGELSGRVIQLEAEAMALTERIGAIQDFEARVAGQDFENIKGRLAKTPPGRSSGGPLLEALPEPSAQPSLTAPSLTAEMLDQMVGVESEIGRLAALLSELDRLAASINITHLSFPERSPMPEQRITSAFGNRIDPFNRRRAFHSGVDYPAPKGSPIHASAGGKVIFAGRRPFYGNTVEIDHGAGLVTRYAHASRLNVKLGDVVMPGEKIAEVGSTGRSTGPHLHFEILKDGHFVDPTVYLARF